MRARIQRLTIEGVRGILPELVIDLDGKTVLLRGDNGTGKSSIVQGLRHAVCGSPHGSGVSIPEDCFRHRNLPAGSSPRVVVDLSNGGVVDVGRDTTNPHGARFRDACTRTNPFFRRDELQDLLTVSPGDRFKYLKRFLDLHVADRLVDNLNKKRKALDEAAERKRVRLEERTESVLKTLGAPHDRSGTPDLLAYGRSRAARLDVTVAPDCDWPGLVAACTEAATKAGSAELAERKRLLTNARARIAELVPPNHPRTSLDPLRLAEAVLHEADLSDLLDRALAHVESHADLTECPVCEQRVDAGKLAAALKARLASLKEIKEAKVAAETHAAQWHGFLTELGALERLAACDPSPPSPLREGRALLEHLEETEGETISVAILGRKVQLQGSLDRELDDLRAVDRAAELEALRTAVDAAAKDAPEVDRLRGEVESADRLLSQLQTIEKAVSTARKAVFEAEVNGVKATFERFYRYVHPADDPSEVTAAPTLRVTNRGSGTAELLGVFLGETVGDPRHLYSDGHLDTVAICLFLALRHARARDPEDPRILVLDDVILSIDVAHTDRLLELLRDEFDDHQIIIVSHSELFMRRCQRYLQGAKRLDINRWTPQDGPRIVGYVSHVDLLRSALDNTGSNEQVANALRPVLDDFLSEACDAFEVALPTGRHRPLTLSDYWEALKKKLRKLSDKGVIPTLDDLLRSTEDAGFFRNALGAHLNEWALQVPLAAVQRLAVGILGLIETLQCTACSAIVHPVTPDQPQTIFTCRCPRKQGPTWAGAPKACQTNGASGVEAT